MDIFGSCQEQMILLNVAGHRLSTGAIEEVLSEHQSVAEFILIKKIIINQFCSDLIA